MAALKTALAVALLVAVNAPAQASRPLPEPVFAMTTPAQFVGALYIDLSGILRSPKVEKPPAWWDYLTPRTEALRVRLAELDNQADWTTFRYDWLCQCEKTRRMWAQPMIQTETRSRTSARMRVAVRISGSEQYTVWLLLINRGGWKIDDIIDERGHRYTEALSRAIATYERGRKPLPEDRPQ